jgi:hypothetical protein
MRLTTPLLVALVVLAGIAAVGAEGNYTDTGYGYMEAFTGTTFNCAYGKCGYGQTRNLNYSFSPTSAWALQTASAGWNTDLGTHCVDYEASPMVYNTSYNRSPNTLAWGTNLPVPPHWVSSWSFDKPVNSVYVWPVESYTSSDGAHSNSYWVFGC